jgi:hypothetical protein
MFLKDKALRSQLKNQLGSNSLVCKYNHSNWFDLHKDNNTQDDKEVYLVVHLHQHMANRYLQELQLESLFPLGSGNQLDK